MLELPQTVENGGIIYQEAATQIGNGSLIITYDTRKHNLPVRLTLLASAHIMMGVSEYWLMMCQQYQTGVPPYTIKVSSELSYHTVYSLCWVLHHPTGDFRIEELYANALGCLDMISLAEKWSCSNCNRIRRLVHGILYLYLQAPDKARMRNTWGMGLGDMIALARRYNYSRAFWHTTNEAIYQNSMFDLVANTSRVLAPSLQDRVISKLCEH